MVEARKYRVFTLRNFAKVPQVQQYLTPEQLHDIEVVGNVLPFKVNNYVIDELIDWTNIPHDPIFQLTFPQREMLSAAHYREMEKALSQDLSKAELKLVANKIRYELNPHPDGQQHNVPMLDDTKLTGIQHKYRETVLFFPSNSQTCHAYCTFCFRWPQFVGIDELKFAMKETDLLVEYLRRHPEVTDVLFTGGDPMVMSAKKMRAYIEPLLEADLPNLRTIRIGTKSLAYWPYKFLTDKDADEMIALFEEITERGYHLAFMAHFNNPVELKTEAVRQAIKRIIATGAQIRTQSPVMKHINDRPADWKEMWLEQVKLGCIPYYMFVARDTGAQDYFAVELERIWDIYHKAYQQVSGIARTVRGPSMSTNPGKVQILGINEINNKKVFTLRFIQGRQPSWVNKPFFAKFDPDAIWLDDLEPAFAPEFFYEQSSALKNISLN
ncbi:KamA family radical SAM protein [Flavilitoribacter nigricans]|uniref:Lysine 2,3-aminomutase n=1 Tax=Flavilitoribacter nigricans (strain ATCC 23147 / DSM 23189 / NBRC 102662 / NCIMB 1420 / SS-2) TaxID=1122177 RepID=A0A2D0NHN5_FLAN2|nr:lysine 2,3-aminomutase [Flavilitoribacter nigricans]PHN07890.1 lysine 2,3-aminomutase [Flavilitoribacter nigricans DSM 23189 = NBRC 102662]